MRRTAARLGLGGGGILALLLLLAPPALARSLTIESLDVDIRIAADSTLHVEERIHVRFDGTWNGIFRNIPYGYRYRTGIRGTIDLLVDAVEDGEGNDLTYWSKRRNGELNLKIKVPGASNATRLVVIKYRARNAMRQFGADEDPDFGAHDQLYWNFVGPSWEMQILRARATVHLPPTLKDFQPGTVKTLVYRGHHGRSDDTSQGRVSPDGTVVFESDRALPPYVGMTIVVGFPTGHLTYPGFLQKAWWFLQVNWSLLIPFLLLALWFWSWWRHGRDSLRGFTIIPEFEPPLGLGPAEVGVLLDDSLNRHDVTAGIVGLAVRRVLAIHDKGESRRLVLDRDALTAAERDLSPFERDLVDALFGNDKDSVKMSSLKYKFYKRLPGLKSAVLDDLVERKLFPKRPDKVVSGWIGKTLLALIAAVVLGIVLQFPAPFWGAMILAAVGMFFVAPNMPRRTRRGLAALAKVKGMQDYMLTAEEQRMKSLPMETFERLLPYAIAFGIHDRWIEAFEDVFAQKPDWYVSSASGWNAGVFRSGIDGLGNDVRSNMYSGPRPTRTSGGSSSWGGGWSGGGGFSGGSSGGGFGGGGGGGW